MTPNVPPQFRQPAPWADTRLGNRQLWVSILMGSASVIWADQASAQVAPTHLWGLVTEERTEIAANLPADRNGVALAERGDLSAEPASSAYRTVAAVEKWGIDAGSSPSARAVVRLAGGSAQPATAEQSKPLVAPAARAVAATHGAGAAEAPQLRAESVNGGLQTVLRVAAIGETGSERGDQSEAGLQRHAVAARGDDELTRQIQDPQRGTALLSRQSPLVPRSDGGDVGASSSFARWSPAGTNEELERQGRHEVAAASPASPPPSDAAVVTDFDPAEDKGPLLAGTTVLATNNVGADHVVAGQGIVVAASLWMDKNGDEPLMARASFRAELDRPDRGGDRSQTAADQTSIRGKNGAAGEVLISLAGVSARESDKLSDRLARFAVTSAHYARSMQSFAVAPAREKSLTASLAVLTKLSPLHPSEFMFTRHAGSPSSRIMPAIEFGSVDQANDCCDASAARFGFYSAVNASTLSLSGRTEPETVTLHTDPGLFNTPWFLDGAWDMICLVLAGISVFIARLIKMGRSDGQLMDAVGEFFG